MAGRKSFSLAPTVSCCRVSAVPTSEQDFKAVGLLVLALVAFDDHLPVACHGTLSREQLNYFRIARLGKIRHAQNSVFELITTPTAGILWVH